MAQTTLLARDASYFAALRTEIETDPQGLNYAVYRNNGADNMLEYLINYLRDGTPEPITNVTKTISITDGIITREEFYQSLVGGAGSDLANLTAPDLALLQIWALQPQLNTEDTVVKANINRMFPTTGGGTTRNLLKRRATRNGSRAETLWGAGWKVAIDDIVAARGAGW